MTYRKLLILAAIYSLPRLAIQIFLFSQAFQETC